MKDFIRAIFDINDRPQFTKRFSQNKMNVKALFNEIGVRAFRELIKSFGARRWYSLRKELKDLVFTSGNDIF